MKKILSLTVLVLVLISCGKKDNRPMSEYLSAFMNGNTTVATFGKVDLNTILKKSDYAKVPKFGLLVQKELEGLQNEINVQAPIYFALEGPFAEDVTPETTYLFLEVKNADSLNANLTERGYDIDTKGDLFFHASGDVAFGFKNNLLILCSKKKEFDGEQLVKDAFEKVGGDLAGGKIDEILASTGDMVMGISISNLYKTSNTDLNNLSKEKQDQLMKMVDDSYVLSTLKLDAGSATFETKNLFSSELSKRMFFKNDGKGSVVSVLGTGEPRLGVSANLDMKKMQAMINEFSPNAMKELGEAIGGPAQFALMTGGDDALASLFNGQIGLVMVGEVVPGGSMTPDFNVFVGLEKGGQTMAEGFKSFLDAGMAKVNLDSKGLAAYSNALYVPKAGSKLKVPQGCEIFGKKGLTVFLNLEGLNIQEFGFKNEQKLIHLLKYATFEMDNNGSKLFLKAKEDKANVMKQVVNLLVEELSDKISGISI
jgi:hypothetical protein